MAKCKLCGRSGFLLSVSRIGLCDRCNPGVMMEVNNRIRIIQDSIEIVNKTKNIKTAVSRYDLLIEHLQALVDYERKGIQVTNSRQESNLNAIKQERDKSILNWLEKDLEDAIVKSKLATTSAGKTNPLSKSIINIREYKEMLKNKELADVILYKALNEFNLTQLRIYLEKAEKAELKGKTSQALDAYYEAYYFITHDGIDDDLQKETIQKLKNKISQLGGKSLEELAAGKAK